MKATQITNNQLVSNYPYTRSKTDISSLRGCFNTLSSSVNTRLKNQAIEQLHNFFKLECTPSKVSRAAIKGTDLSKSNITLKIKDMFFFERTQSGYVNVDKKTEKSGEYSFLPFNPQDPQLKNIAQNFKARLMEFRSIGDLVVEQKDDNVEKEEKLLVGNIEDKVQIDPQIDALNLSGITNLTDNPYVLDLSYRDGKDKLLDEYIIENNLLSEKVRDLEDVNEQLSNMLKQKDATVEGGVIEVKGLKTQLQTQIDKYKQVADELGLVKAELQKSSLVVTENKSLKDQYNALQTKYDVEAVGLRSRYETDICNLKNQLTASQNEATNYRNQYNTYYNQVSSLNNQISTLQNTKASIEILTNKGAQITQSNTGFRVSNSAYVEIRSNAANWNFTGV